MGCSRLGYSNIFPKLQVSHEEAVCFHLHVGEELSQRPLHSMSFLCLSLLGSRADEGPPASWL